MNSKILRNLSYYVMVIWAGAFFYYGVNIWILILFISLSTLFKFFALLKTKQENIEKTEYGLRIKVEFEMAWKILLLTLITGIVLILLK
jgi:phosphatidylglycerophosphate synthase